MAIAAENFYFFRKPILRDAAYQLQMPSERARLHRQAMEILEAMFGGVPPEPYPDKWGDLKCAPHPSDLVAADLAAHVRGICKWETDDDGSLQRLEVLYLRRAAERAEAQFHNDDAVRLWQRLAAVSERDAPATAAESLRRAGTVLANSGRTLDAELLFERAQKIAADASNRRTEGIALGNLACIYHETGRAEAAETTYRRALSLHREVGNRRSEATALGNLAVLYEQTGRPEEAERIHEVSLAIIREVGDRRLEGMELGALAVMYWESARVEEAERFYEQALKIHREEGNRGSEGVALSNLGILYHDTKGPEAAERTYEQAMVILREVGDRIADAHTIGNLGGIYRDSGRLEEAKALYERALTIHRETRNRHAEGAHSCEYALCLLALRREIAKGTWNRGAEIVKETGDTELIRKLTTHMHEACAKAGVPPFDE